MMMYKVMGIFVWKKLSSIDFFIAIIGIFGKKLSYTISELAYLAL